MKFLICFLDFFLLQQVGGGVFEHAFFLLGKSDNANATEIRGSLLFIL